ncbi:hypothetical protein P4O66_020492 [Electrophorus voltai]|uniref:Alkylated DNA repair protein AlkB homologue 8 N-terminal domain-containing protein n=1 Tax=Electrophorus voltai TaxID=2609070 RepID=A0AAD9E4U1_9TELE|nr:hypothetical protein P4O66_020492 [Electrophorus voltai]
MPSVCSWLRLPKALIAPGESDVPKEIFLRRSVWGGLSEEIFPEEILSMCRIAQPNSPHLASPRECGEPPTRPQIPPPIFFSSPPRLHFCIHECCMNTSKTKELIMDCSKKQERHYQRVRINGTTVERVDSFRYIGVHILQHLSWSCNTNSLAKKARQHLYHLRRLRDFRLPSKMLRNFYTCTIKSILTGNITVWFENCTKQDRQALQRVVHSSLIRNFLTCRPSTTSSARPRPGGL